MHIAYWVSISILLASAGLALLILAKKNVPALHRQMSRGYIDIFHPWNITHPYIGRYFRKDAPYRFSFGVSKQFFMMLLLITIGLSFVNTGISMLEFGLMTYYSMPMLYAWLIEFSMLIALVGIYIAIRQHRNRNKILEITKDSIDMGRFYYGPVFTKPHRGTSFLLKKRLILDRDDISAIEIDRRIKPYPRLIIKSRIGYIGRNFEEDLLPEVAQKLNKFYKQKLK